MGVERLPRRAHILSVATFPSTEQMELASNYFIQCQVKVLPHNIETLPYVFGLFHPEFFSDALWTSLSIALPAHLAQAREQRRSAYLAGRICARSALALHDVHGVQVLSDTGGAPVWPNGMVGSISHNKEYAAALAYPARNIRGIGIDIETPLQADGVKAVMDMTLSHREAKCLLASASGWSKELLFTAAFSVKESFFKAAFPEVGSHFYFDAVEIFQVNAARGLIGFRCTRTLSAHLTQGQEHWAHFSQPAPTAILTAVVLPARAVP